MDRLDIDILREMTRDNKFLWATSNPFLSSDDIADRLGLAGSTVRARLRAWEKSGFLKGVELLPNPALLRVRFARVFVRIDDLRAKPRVLADIALVPGALGVLDHVGPWVGVALAQEREGDLPRARALLARLPGVDEVTPTELFPEVPVALRPSPLDWRLIRALHAAPNAPFAQVAASLGISTRTFTRRYHALAEAGAVWVFPMLDFTAFTGGVVGRLTVATDGAASRKVAEALRGAFPDMLELHEHHAAKEQPASVDVLLWQPSVGAMEDAVRAVLDMPHVKGAELVYPRRLQLFRQWWDERLDERAAAGAPRARK